MSDQPSKEMVEAALARGYCHPDNSHKELDAVLIEAMTTEVLAALASRSPAPADRATREIISHLQEMLSSARVWGVDATWVRAAIDALVGEVELVSTTAEIVEEWPDKTKIGMFLCDLDNEDWDDVSRPKYEADARAILGFIQSEIVYRPRFLPPTDLTECERHDIAHAEWAVGHATPDKPEVCFDYTLVQTLLGLIKSSRAATPADRAKIVEEIRTTLERCRTVLGNMALENEGAIFKRWPINHEPLRADARGLLPVIDHALYSIASEARQKEEGK